MVVDDVSIDITLPGGRHGASTNTVTAFRAVKCLGFSPGWEARWLASHGHWPLASCRIDFEGGALYRPQGSLPHLIAFLMSQNFLRVGGATRPWCMPIGGGVMAVVKRLSDCQRCTHYQCGRHCKDC
jgi:hypothetical protein